MKIKFGTSGWRAIIANQFTFARVRIVVQAIVDYIKLNEHPLKPVIIGSDPRFLSDEFMHSAAEVLAGNGIQAHICPVGVPTPVVAQ